MKPWTREDTKDWIAQLEHRIDDINYYLSETLKWCEHKEIEDDHVVFMCSFLTCVWVTGLRGEYITYNELMEILNVHQYVEEGEKIYEIDDKWLELEHNELLEKIVETCDKYDEE